MLINDPKAEPAAPNSEPDGGAKGTTCGSQQVYQDPLLSPGDGSQDRPIPLQQQQQQHGFGGLSRMKRSGTTTTTGSSIRRWSSRRRRFSRQQSQVSYFLSEDLDLQQLQQPLISGLLGVPLRLQGMAVAALAIVAGAVGIVTSSVLILRNFVVQELSRWPPECDSASPSLVNETAGAASNCTSSSSVLIRLLAKKGLRDSMEFSEIFDSTWWRVTLAVSVAFFYSGVKLALGLWFGRRRLLLPWLLVAGAAVLCFITTSVWVVICNKGWAKLAVLVPAVLAVVFLYWWMIVNDLLEEINDDKKAEFAETEVPDESCSTRCRRPLGGRRGQLGLTTTVAAAAAEAGLAVAGLNCELARPLEKRYTNNVTFCETVAN